MRAFPGLLCVLLLAMPACAQEPAELFPGDTWPTSTPEAEGFEADQIRAIVDDITQGEYGLVDAFMLIRHGKVVVNERFEQDYWAVMEGRDTTDYIYNYDHPNWHPYLEGTRLHTLQSVTKSVTSALLGIAIDEGLLGGPESLAMPWFEDYEPYTTDSVKESTTLEDFLTMRSGIQWYTGGGYTDQEHDTIRMENSREWIRFVLDKPMDAEPGTRYQYNDGVSVLLGKILREATGRRADEWARERLFEPIGIDEFYWKITPDGEADTEGGLYLTTEDLARFGYLFLRNGRWNGKQIISEAWVRASTSPVVADVRPDNDQDDPGYGYQWWVPDQEGGRSRIFAGNGYGGQFVLVAPEYDIVAVFNGWNLHTPANKSIYRALQERILPAAVE
jgi:CubicO group peptidase (beta-lactamase class C family)